MRWVGALLVALLLAGCGYKPAATHARVLLGDKIHVKVLIDLRDPKNSVIIKDALNAAVVGRFHSDVAQPEEADTILEVALKEAALNPIAYDSTGYASAYRAEVVLEVGYEGTKKRFWGRHDFAVRTTSIISDALRFDAIKSASMQALDAFIASVGTVGLSRP